MRHVTRRRHRVRRARLTRRLQKRSQKQRGGAALGDTESLTKWLRKVFDRYTKLGQAEDASRPFADAARGAELGAIIAEDPDAVKFIADDSKYTLPLEIQPSVVMPPENQTELYDLRGNYGNIVRMQVLELSSAQEGQTVSQMSTLRFSTTVEGMMADAGLYPIEEMLKTENILRGLLRADLSAEEIARYRHIAEDVTSLSDVKMYPLYVWAIALNFDAGATKEIRPVLEQSGSDETTKQAGPAQPAE